jgi:sn-glycerol 3-phosphate transport system substrate-binding protein
MRNSPKLLLFGFALAAVVAASCGGGEKEAATPTMPGETATATATRPARKPYDITAPVTIDFWHSMTASNLTTLEGLIKDFESQQPNIKVNLVFQGNFTDSFNKLLAVGIDSKDAPAVIQLEDVLTQTMTDSKKTVPMQDFVDRDRFDLSKLLPQVREYYTVGGMLRSMPFNISNPIMYYDANLFRSVGLDPARPPANFDELAAACEKLMVKKGDRITRHCIAMDISSWYFEQWLAKQNALYVNNGNGRDARADAVAFNSDEGLRIMRWWNEGVKSGLILNVGKNPAGPDALLSLVNPDGGAAIAIQSSANLRPVVDFLEANKSLNIDPAVAPLPSPVPGGKGIVVGGASLWIPATGDTAKEEAAWRLVQFLTSMESQAKWHAGSGYLPVRADSFDLPVVQDLYKTYPQFRLLVGELKESPNTRATQGALVGPAQQVRDALVNAIEEMLLTGTAPGQALKSAEQTANDAIKRYNRSVQ